MGMMAQMRNLAPWFIITVGGLFVLFMVLSDSRLTDVMGQRQNVVGTINGEDITYVQFNEVVERYRQQLGNIEEDQIGFLRDQVWNDMVARKVMEDKIEEFGITVTDEEIREKLLGPNPPEFLKQNFIDSTGQFNRQAYETALFDPQNKEILLNVEEMMREQIYNEKLRDYVNASVTVSESEIRDEFYSTAVKMKAEYAKFNPNFVPDSLAPVVDAEIEEYYNNHSDEYKQPQRRKLQYVLFNTQASQADTVSIVENLKAIAEDARDDTASFKTFVEIYSEQPYSRDTTSITQIPAKAQDDVVAAEKGDIVGPVLTAQGAIVYNILDKIPANETEAVRASHILVRFNNDKDAAKRKADSLYNILAAGEDFARIAAVHSEDRANAGKGGDLGWFGRGQMVTAFEDAAFGGSVGRLQRPVETNFGYHIIMVTGKVNQKYVVERIIDQIEPSATTVDKIYNDAGDFAYLADKNGFEQSAGELNYQIQETDAFDEEVRNIRGLGASTAIKRFAFDNSVGDISNVLKAPTGYAVVKISENLKPGLRPLEKVRNAIVARIKRDKKLAETVKLAQQAKQLIGESGDLEKAKAVTETAVVATTEEFTLGGSVQGIGVDPVFNAYAFEGEVGKVSDPVKGERSTYLIKVTYRTNIDSTMYNLQRGEFIKQVLSKKKQNYFTDWLSAATEEAEVKDNRYLFYQ